MAAPKITTPEEAQKAYKDFIDLVVRIASFYEFFGKAPPELLKMQDLAWEKFQELQRKVEDLEPSVEEG